MDESTVERDPRLLVILERDVGMFSLFHQVVNTLRLIEQHNLDCVPIVLFGTGCIYFHDKGFLGKRSVWEYYFEPLSPGYGENQILDELGPEPFETIESMRKWQERERGKVEFPQDLHLLPPETVDDVRNYARVLSSKRLSHSVWREAFNPVIDGRRLDPSSVSVSPKQIVDRYMKYRPHISQAIDDFHARHLAGHHVIGVHIRGTDGNRSPARGFDISFDRYFAAIEHEFDAVGRENCRVFVASDEQNFIDLFVEKYGDLVVSFDSIRKTDDDKVFGKGPTGQGVPAYITKSQDVAVRNGRDVVIEYGLLCKSQIFIHNYSGISDAVKYSVARSVYVS